MFKAPFSFSGRIRRMEYGFSLLLYVIVVSFLNGIMGNSFGDESVMLGLLYIPLFWFICAQGTKRCHDLSNSGWYQLIPFYGFWMLFQEGHILANQYGQNPKQPAFSRSNQYNIPETSAHSPIISALQTIENGELAISNQSEPKQQMTILQENIDGVQTTELEIQNVSYGLLQDMFRTLRSVKFVHGISYEFNGTVGKVIVKHDRSSQDLLDELYGIVQRMEVLVVANGSIIVRLK